MYILGISAFDLHPAACILRDGKLMAFAEEERFIRVKGAFGRFPIHAVSYCLRHAGIKLRHVDGIAVGWDAEKYRFMMPLFFLWSAIRYGGGKGEAIRRVLEEIVNQQPNEVKRRITYALSTLEPIASVLPITFISHHLAHAASSYYASGFDRAAILVVDGSGEERATSIFFGDGEKIHEKDHRNIPHSLGWFYAAITAYLGFVPNMEEGHVMGLAAYGKPNRRIQRAIDRILLQTHDGRYRVHPRYTLLGHHEASEHFSDELVELLGPPRLPHEPLSDRHRDIAYAAQDALESAIVSLVRTATNDGRTRNLCLAGGVTLNCQANGTIANSGLVDELFVQPAADDAGGALGAAMVVAKENNFDPRFRMEHVFYGPGYRERDIERILRDSGVSFEKPRSIVDVASDSLVNGRVVAWFNGRMEVGPRALGHRSILALPQTMKMRDYINQKVKFRAPWRPLCPSMPVEVADTYLDQPKESRFMTIAYPVHKDRRKELSAVDHVDGTTRPQTVDRRVDPTYHALLVSVGEKTGTPVLLNTSLNVHGEPIACTPEDAIRCFASTGVDALAIAGLWVEKQ